MADMKDKAEQSETDEMDEKNEMGESKLQAFGGEYGIGRMLADEKNLEEAQKKGLYHYSEDELEHKEDRIGK